MIKYSIFTLYTNIFIFYIYIMKNLLKKAILIGSILLLLIVGTVIISSKKAEVVLQKNNKNLTIGNNQSWNQQMPPTEAISACNGKLINTSCEFQTKDWVLTGICNDKHWILACAPNINPSEGNPNNKKESSPETDTILAQANSGFISCINNTKDNPECKDCCDCLGDTDSDTRKSCRDICATHNFSLNSWFIQVTFPSILGASGDYSVCLQNTNANECKICCENTMWLQCGDYRFCRTVCDNTFDGKKNINANQ